MTSTDTTQNWKANFTDFLKGRGKIQALGELTAVQAMQATAKENQRNSEAESSYVRRHVWDEQESEVDDTMGNTVLGDITHPSPVVYPPTPPSQLPLAAALVLSTLIPTSALTAWYLSTRTPAPAPPANVGTTDETLQIGLGRIEDYLKP